MGTPQWGVAVSVFLSLLAFGAFSECRSRPIHRRDLDRQHSEGQPSSLRDGDGHPHPVDRYGLPRRVAVFTRQISRVGESLGTLYAASTAGSIAGCVITGFFLVSLAGTQNSMLIMIITSCCIATLALFLSADRVRPRKVRRSGLVLAFLRMGAFAPWPAVIAALFIMPAIIFSATTIRVRRCMTAPR